MRQKLALIALPVLIPVGLLLYLSYTANAETIRVAQEEKKGLEYCRKIRKTLEHLQQHRGLASMKSVDFAYRGQLTEKQAQLEADLREVDAVDAKYGADFRTTEAWNKFRAEWTVLKNQSLTLAPDESLTRHNKLIADLITVNTTAAEASTLVLDPAVDTYWLQLVLFDRSPEISDNIAEMRARIGSAVGRKTLSAEEAVKFEILAAQTRNTAGVIGRNLNSAYAYNPELKSKLEPANNEL